MSKNLEISFDKQVAEVIREIGYYIREDYAVEATRFALNATAEKLKGDLAREVLKIDDLLLLKAIRRRLRVWKSNRNDSLESKVIGYLSNVRLTELGKPVQNRSMIGTRIKGRMYPHAFLATMHKKTGRDVYIRTSPKRFPVKMVNIRIYEEAVKMAEKLSRSKALMDKFEERYNYKIRALSGYRGSKG